MKFLSQSEQDLQARILQQEGSLQNAIHFECEVMVKHALDEGKSLPESLLADLKRIKAAAKAGKLEDADHKAITRIHARLSELVKPALPGTLVHLHQERENNSWLHFLGPIPFFRTMMLVAIVFLFGLIGLSLSPHINVIQINKGIFDSSGSVLLINLLFLVAAAGLGAVFAALYESNNLLRNRTFNPARASSYWARIAMGLVAGIILAELVPVRPPEGENGISVEEALASLDSAQAAGTLHLEDDDAAARPATPKPEPAKVPLAPITPYDTSTVPNSTGAATGIPVDTSWLDTTSIATATASPDSLSEEEADQIDEIGQANRGGVMKVIVAVLGGFSANLLFNILIKMGNALENVVGSGDDIMNRIQQLDRRIIGQGQQDDGAEEDENQAASLPAVDPPPTQNPPASGAPPATPATTASAPVIPAAPRPVEHQYLDLAQLKAMMPGAKEATVAKYVDAFNRALHRYEINTPVRIAHFVAQVGHESGSFQWPEEIWFNPQLDANGVATKGTRSQLNYEGKKDLGNTEVGDGYRFRGRGLIQLTGRANYAKYSEFLQQSGYPLSKPLTETPDLVGQPELAVDSAAWFWRHRARKNLNLVADQDDVTLVTKGVNGGLTHLEDRKKRLALAKAALGIS
jgi:putative chitinase